MTHPRLPDIPPSADEAAVRAFGESLGATLQPPVVVALRGELGAGKTTLAQAIARGAGVADDVTSPTFALVHEYESGAADRRVFHIDLYRLRGPAELTNIGWDDIINEDAVVLVEWPERAGARLPARRLDITLREVDGAEDRRSVEAAWTD